MCMAHGARITATLVPFSLLSCAFLFRFYFMSVIHLHNYHSLCMCGALFLCSHIQRPKQTKKNYNAVLNCNTNKMKRKKNIVNDSTKAAFFSGAHKHRDEQTFHRIRWLLLYECLCVF